ncbi:MAG TPA: Clp1/GlmU family protein [Terriglobales bacterium]|nr:Clp1/GlmU family protein [Terriglobales bacterium]
MLAAAPVVMVLGAAEAGKTTFTTWLANLLHAREHRVAIVDADVGQSEIGPPATVGLGAVRAPLARPGDADLVAFAFVGAMSPGRQPWRTAEATGRLVLRARAAFDRVVVDTSGFVAGGFAAALKQRKIAAADPDLVVLLQRADECEHLVRPLAERARPRVLRLPVVTGGRPRSPAVRRRHREAALARYFADARAIVLDATRVALRSLRDEPAALADVTLGALIELRDADARTLGLGVVEAVDVERATLRVRTTAGARAVASVTIGEATAA